MCCLLHFDRGYIIFFAKFYDELFCQHLLVGEGEERIHEVDIKLSELFHIVFDVLGVRGDHRAVVVVACLRSFVALVGDTRIEDIAYTLTDEPGNMTVHQLGRVALRFTRDGLDAQLVDFSGGLRGQDHTEFQFL